LLFFPVIWKWWPWLLILIVSWFSICFRFSLQ